MLLATLDLRLGPDRGLHLTDVCLLQEEHAETALTDTATDRGRQLARQQGFVEGQLRALHATTDLQLPQQRLRTDTDAHRRQLKRAAQHLIPEDDVAIQAPEAIDVECAPIVVVWRAAIVLLAVAQLVADANDEDGAKLLRRFSPLALWVVASGYICSSSSEWMKVMSSGRVGVMCG